MKGRVLVVDDDDALAEMLGIVLRGEGFEPTFVSDGDKAMDAFHESRPDLVLLDMRLPGLDGFEVCRRLKADPTTSDVPIVAVSGLSGGGQRERALALGCADWIAKPFDVDDLLARVRPYLLDAIR